MRFPSFPTILHTFYAFSNATAKLPFSAARYKALGPLTRASAVRSVGAMPILGSLFSSKSQDNMEFPVKKSDDEWQAVLNKGECFILTETYISLSHATVSYLMTVFSSSYTLLQSTTFSYFPVRSRLTTLEQFRILREKGTESPGSGVYDKHYPSEGVYACAGCSAPLYKATHKFKSGCGWPAYFDSLPGAVTRHTDRSFGMARTEIVCSNCGGHLGHVFKGEGYATPTDERHCVNSVSLKFHEKEEGAKEGKEEDAKM